MACSQESWRPCQSKLLPFELLLGARNVETCPSSSSQRNWRLFGMSLQIRNRPTAFQAGPSAQSAPVQRRRIALLGTMEASKAGSTASTSGSVK